MGYCGILVGWANKGPSSQSYGFSSSHVWMWELDYKECWEPKNWWFWTVVLEKTLESPLDWKEIQLVNYKGNQSWIFIGRTDVQAEAQYLATWSEELTHWKKDPDAGKDWSEEEKGTTEDEIVGWHHQPSWHESEQTLGVSDVQGSLACCSPWGCKESDTTELIIQSYINTATKLIIRWYIIPFIAQMFPLLATGSSVPWLLCFSCTPVSLWVWGYLFILAHPYFL